MDRGVEPGRPRGLDDVDLGRRIAGDVERPGVDITPAVIGMSQRRREREYIDVATLHDVFHYRASLYHLIRDGVLDDILECVVERPAKL